MCEVRSTGVRSVQTAYNNAAQTFTIDGGIIDVLGTQICDAGCGIDTITNGFIVKRAGVYRFSYDVVFEATGAGTAEIQLFEGSNPLPCSYSKFVTAAGGIYPMHIETTIPVRACYGVRPIISCRVDGAAGDVTHVCASAVKIV